MVHFLAEKLIYGTILENIVRQEVCQPAGDNGVKSIVWLCKHIFCLVKLHKYVTDLNVQISLVIHLLVWFARSRCLHLDVRRTSVMVLARCLQPSICLMSRVTSYFRFEQFCHIATKKCCTLCLTLSPSLFIQIAIYFLIQTGFSNLTKRL